MEAYCQNPFCQNKAIKKVSVSVEKPSDQVRSLCALCEEAYTWGVQHGTMTCEGLKINPPPEEKGDEPLFRVVYMIDVNAGDVREAAEYTHRIMTDPQSQRPVLQVVDSEGKNTEIDLSENGGEIRKEPATECFTKTTVGFVVQTFRKNSGGRYVCTHQEFIAGDQCDYEDVRGNPVEPPDYDYQPYNMTLRAATASETAQAAMLKNAYEAIEEVLESLDVGGEQSRQFAGEIKILKDVIGDSKSADDDSDKGRKHGVMAQ